MKIYTGLQMSEKPLEVYLMLSLIYSHWWDIFADIVINKLLIASTLPDFVDLVMYMRKLLTQNW